MLPIYLLPEDIQPRVLLYAANTSGARGLYSMLSGWITDKKADELEFTDLIVTELRRLVASWSSARSPEPFVYIAYPQQGPPKMGFTGSSIESPIKDMDRLKTEIKTEVKKQRGLKNSHVFVFTNDVGSRLSIGAVANLLWAVGLGHHQDRQRQRLQMLSQQQEKDRSAVMREEEEQIAFAVESFNEGGPTNPYFVERFFEVLTPEQQQRVRAAVQWHERYPIGFSWQDVNGNTLTVESIDFNTTPPIWYVSDSSKPPRFRWTFPEEEMDQSTTEVQRAKERRALQEAKRAEREASVVDALELWREAPFPGCTWKPIDSGLGLFEDLIHVAKTQTRQDLSIMMQHQVRLQIVKTLQEDNELNALLLSGQKISEDYKGRRYAIFTLSKANLFNVFFTGDLVYIRSHQCPTLIREVVKSHAKGSLKQVWAIPMTKELLDKVSAFSWKG